MLKNFRFDDPRKPVILIVNFNSTENNSARDLDFSQAKTAEAASFN